MAPAVQTRKKFNKYTFVSTKLGAKVLVNGKQKSADSDPAFSTLKVTIKGINNLGAAFNSLNSQLVDLSSSIAKTFKVFKKIDERSAKVNLADAKLTAQEMRSERKKDSDEKNRTRKSLDTSSESASEKKNPLGLDKEKKEKVEKPSLGLFDFLKNFIQLFIKYAITSSVLKWMMDPKNTEKLGNMFKAIRSIFKFIWNVTEKLAGFITGAVVNLGSGVFDTVEGLKKGDVGQVLNGLGQVLTAIPGILALRWLLNPMSLFKDIAGILGKEDVGPGNKGGKGNNQGRTGITGNTSGRTPTTSAAAARRYADRYGIDAARKRFGKDAVKSLGGKYARSGVTNVARKAMVSTLGKGGSKAVLKFAKPFLKRLPIVGALIDFGLSVALGEPLGRAAFKSIGSFILGAIGTGFGGPIGAVLGGFAGDWLGGKLYDIFFAKKPDGKNKPPEFEEGGIVKDGKKLKPQQVGAVLVDSTTQTLSGLGPGGKVAEQFLGGEISRLQTTFGKSGVLINQTKIRSATKKSNEDLKDSKDGGMSQSEGLIGKDAKPSITIGQVSGDTSVVGLLASVVGVLGMLVNKDFNKGGESQSGGSTSTSSSTPDSSGIDTSGVEAASGSVVDKGVAIAKKFMSNLGLSKESAAAIAGNFAHESGGFIPGIREGGPFGKSSKPWPKGTVGKGYGWAQWTNSRPGDRYDKFIESYGGDYNKIATNEDNLKFAIQEMKTVEPLSSGFKKMTDVAAAAVWFRKNWERAGVHHDGPRISYSKGILAKMAIGGPLGADPGRQGRERHTAVVTQFSKAKTIKDSDLPGYAAGGSHRTVPNTPSTSWAAGIPLTYVTASNGKRAEVAVPLAKRFQGFVKDLEGTGYKIKEMGGFRPDGPPGGNADGKGPMYAHPYGAAIDINWTRNPAFTKIPSKRYGDFPSNTKQIASKWGLGWGSAFDDAMHFSAMKREYGQGIDGKEISAKTLGASGAGADFKPGDSITPSSSPDQQTAAAPQKNWMDAIMDAVSGKTAQELISGTSSGSGTPTPSLTGTPTPSSSGSYTPGSIPSSGSLNIQQLVSLSLKVGFKGRHAAIAAAVAYAESTGNPMAHNKVPPDNSYGLWQINMIGNLGPARRKQWGLKSNEELFNPETNAKIAYKISGGVNFSAWTTYTGGKYKNHLQAAEKALASMQTKAAAGGVIDFQNLNFKIDSKNKLGLDIKNPFTSPTQGTSPLNFVKGMDTSKLSYSPPKKEEKKEIKLTPMQQWAKNFPELAKKVKPGQSGYEEIQAYLFPNKYADISKKGFELAAKGVNLADIKPVKTAANLNADKVIKESPKLPDESVYTKNSMLILNNFRKEIVPASPPQVVRSTPIPQACYTSFFSN